jgi:hypothetical protein
LATPESIDADGGRRFLTVDLEEAGSLRVLVEHLEQRAAVLVVVTPRAFNHRLTVSEHHRLVRLPVEDDGAGAPWRTRASVHTLRSP